MRKFIHSKFELDLSTLKLTDTSENPWFSGSYFAKFSYPFNIPLTPENDLAFGLIGHYNSTGAETLFEGIYIHGDTMEKAVLEIEECEKSLSGTMRYGLDDFPSFDKKLSELPLDKFEVDNIYLHAAQVITLGWPTVNYNFPQIHIDKIETEDSDVWFAFKKIINNYENGAFTVNDVDLTEDITYNRNIIQPLPYLLHVLQAGVAAAGFTLKGDILNDEDSKITLVYADIDYYSTVQQESESLMVAYDEYDTIEMLDPVENLQRIYVSRNIDITNPGKYRITGVIRGAGFDNSPVYARIYYRDTLIGQKYVEDSGHLQVYTNTIIINHLYWNVDLVFETLTDIDVHYLRVEVSTRFRYQTDMLIDLNVNPIRLHDIAGNAIATVINKNQVDLTRAVPDMNFGDFVKAWLQMKNMSIDKRGSEIWVNYVCNEIYNNSIIDLADYEVKFPKRTFSRGLSYHLHYQDANSEDYKYEEVFQNISGVAMSDFKTDEKTKDIPINALPLPLLFRNGVQTAHGFYEDKSKLMFVLYNGLVNSLNLAQSPVNLLIPKLHEHYHREWFQSNLLSQSFSWTFVAPYEVLTGLTAKSRVHAYTNIHIVESLQKTEVAPDIFDVEITTKLFK